MPRLTLNLLGPPQVRLDGQAVHWTYDKLCALLIYLVMEAHQAHTREHLASLRRSPAGGRPALRTWTPSIGRSLSLWPGCGSFPRRTDAAHPRDLPGSGP